MDLKAEVERTATQYRMWEPGDRIIVGVSGGPDSVALLHVLTLLGAGEPTPPFTLVVAHLHHGLRGASADADAELVAALARRWGLDAVIERTDVAALARTRGVGIQEAAREARYEFFLRLAKERGADRIALAHHADDQVETVLFRFLRGTGPKGLAGIPPVRGAIIRPLIEVTRETILDHCRRYDLPFREDPSNLDMRYRRNRIREELIPLIEERYNPAFRSAMIRLARIHREEDEFLEGYAADIYRSLAQEIAGPGAEGEPPVPSEVFLSREALAALHPAMARRVVRRALSRLRMPGKAMGWDVVQRVLEAVGGPFDLPGSIVCDPRPEEIHLYRRSSYTSKGGFDFPVTVPGHYRLGGDGGHIRLWREDVAAHYARGVDRLLAELREGESEHDGPWEAVLDWDRLDPPLRLRSRRPGDRFQPLGMDGTRKLQDVFVDLKIERERRDAVPLLVDGQGIVCVVGYRIAHRVRLHSGTRELLRVRYQRPGSAS